MALINCPECGKEVSDTANLCPHCGYNLKRNKTNNQVQRRRKPWLPFVIIGGVFITLIVIGLPLLFLLLHFIEQ